MGFLTIYIIGFVIALIWGFHNVLVEEIQTGLTKENIKFVSIIAFITAVFSWISVMLFVVDAIRDFVTDVKNYKK